MKPVEIGDYELVEQAGVWFLEQDGRITATLINMGGGVWRARTPQGDAETFDAIPDGVDDVPLWIARQITGEDE